MITAFAVAVAALSPYTVRAVDRHVAFAGRLGDRVEITLQIEREGALRTVRLARRHTRSGPVPEFRIGEQVVLPVGSAPIAPEAIQRVRS